MFKTISVVIICALNLLLLSALGSDPQSINNNSTDPAFGKMIPEQYLSNTIIVSGSDDIKLGPQIAYNSNHDEYLVVWKRANGPNPGIYGQRLTIRGEKIGSVPISIAEGPKERSHPAVDYDPVEDRYLVVWEHDHDGTSLEWDISGRFIPWQGSDPSLAEFKINDSPGMQISPKVAYNANKKEFLVTWQYITLAKDEIIGARLFANGTGFADPSINFTGAITNLQFKYTLVYNLSQNEYLLVWSKLSTTTSYDVYMTRSKYDGGLLSAKETPLATSKELEQEPAAAMWLDKNGYNGYFIVWKSRDSNMKYKLIGKFLAHDLTPYAGTLPIKDPTKNQILQPAAASDHQRDQMLVVWTERSDQDSRVSSIWGRFIDIDQSLGPDFQISVTREDTGTLLRDVPSAAAGGKTNFLAAWEHSRSSTDYWDIHASLPSRYSSYLPITMRN